tara:strand:+ start:112 stop:447 length:336 start_codon:yes stop_codon:yes gene_type:complete
MKKIIPELIILIKYFIFHDIKKGKHLFNNKYNNNYNKLINELPKPKVPRFGPRIIYTSKKNKFQFYRFLYHIFFKKFNYSIIETNLIPSYYIDDPLKYDKEIRFKYYLTYI